MKNTLIILSILILTACQQEGRIFVEHKKLSPDVEWLKKDKRKFNVSIEDNSIPYIFSLSFRFADGYQFDMAKVQVTETSPSGKKEVKKYNLKVREKDGRYIGEAGYDIWDSEHPIEPNKIFAEKGEYTYLIEHIMPQNPLYFAMEVGVVIDKK